MISEMTWQQFSTLPSMSKLPSHEVERRYRIYLNEIIEQRIAYAMLQERIAQQKAMEAAANSGGGKAPIQQDSGLPSNCIEFVVDTTNTDYFAFSFNTTGPINFTVDWGDGTIHDDSGFGGFYEETHTYPETGKLYTVRVCFDDPTIVTALDFYGND